MSARHEGLLPKRGAKALGPVVRLFHHHASDTVNLARPANSIRVGTGGDVVAVCGDGTAVLFKNCFSGEVLPIRALRVNATGTTAMDLVAL
ncbi:hypothetical protein BKK79_00055 [Cupriavidus sp. USMAA2-4]|nr:hypothetical protein BKK79_00055 [Cupriavidus sp. USMAA2-4]